MNQLDGENDHRYDFRINLHKSYMAKLRFKLVITGPAVRHLLTVLWSPAVQFLVLLQPVSVAQSDAHPTDDQKVMGLIPADPATFFHGD